MVKQQHQVFVALLVALDALVVIAASEAAWLVRRAVIERFEWWPEKISHWFKEPAFLYTIPITLACLWFCGLYRPRRDRSLASEVYQVGRAALAALPFLVAMMYVFDAQVIKGIYKEARFVTLWGARLDSGRVQIGTLAVLLPVLLVAHRAAFRSILRGLRRRGWNLRHVIVIGSGRLGQIVTHTLERNSWTGIKVAAFISHQDRTRRTWCMERPVLGGLDDLERILEDRNPDAVYVALPGSEANHLTAVLARLERFPLDVRVVPDVGPRYLPQSMVVGELDGMPILSYRECPTSGMGGVSKRALDLAGAAAAVVIFAPVMLIAAALIRLNGPGPVIFKQRRVSLGGDEFNIYKFRTMHHVEDELGVTPLPRQRRAARPPTLPFPVVRPNPAPVGAVHAASRANRPGAVPASAPPRAHAPHAHASHVPALRIPAPRAHPPHPRVAGWTERNDPRVTPIGRRLRRTSIDELPQLFNVLKGEMSLVGPRPERPELIERFREDWRGYMLRQHVKAGMTGWAQVNGLRGQTSLRKRLQYDLFYVRNWSLGFDVRILLLTVLRGFVHKNAY